MCQMTKPRLSLVPRYSQMFLDPLSASDQFKYDRIRQQISKGLEAARASRDGRVDPKTQHGLDWLRVLDCFARETWPFWAYSYLHWTWPESFWPTIPGLPSDVPEPKCPSPREFVWRFLLQLQEPISFRIWSLMTYWPVQSEVCAFCGDGRHDVNLVPRLGRPWCGCDKEPPDRRFPVFVGGLWPSRLASRFRRMADAWGWTLLDSPRDAKLIFVRADRGRGAVMSGIKPWLDLVPVLCLSHYGVLSRE